MDKETFKSLLPDKPYCSDRKGRLIVRSVDSAIELPLIQYNSPGLHRWSVFDLDCRDAWEVIQASKLPKPNFTAINRLNGHAHFGYLLRTPIYLLGKSSRKPQQFAQAIERGYKRAVGADPAYSGFVGKNPVHPQWEVDWGGNYGYDLAELADCLSKDEKRWIPEMEKEGIGRNCTLFNTVRHPAYRAVLKFKKEGLEQDNFLQAVTDLALEKNAEFPHPLPYTEVAGIGKSITKFTWRHFTQERFSEIQSFRISCRWKGHVKNQPWVEMGISESTYRRRLRRGLIS